MTTIKSKLTKLESFVWNNPHVTFTSLASQTNRTVSAIERAYDRAKRKANIAAKANVVEPFDYTLTLKS